MVRSVSSLSPSPDEQRSLHPGRPRLTVQTSAYAVAGAGPRLRRVPQPGRRQASCLRSRWLDRMIPLAEQ